jgi:hypothetical protein
VRALEQIVPDRPHDRCAQLRLREPGIGSAALAALGVRSGSLPFARSKGSGCKRQVWRSQANGRERPPTFAMQKVEGSSPFIRSPLKPRNRGFALHTFLEAPHAPSYSAADELATIVLSFVADYCPLTQLLKGTS